MLQNAYFLGKIGADTAENEQHFPKFCRSAAVSPTGRGPRRGPRGRLPEADVDAVFAYLLEGAGTVNAEVWAKSELGRILSQLSN